MDKIAVIVLSIVVALSSLFVSCESRRGLLSGEWKVDKVEMDFDESRVTPEMVRQIGAQEKMGYMIFNADSSLHLYDGEVVMKTRYSCGTDGSLYYESTDSARVMTYLGRYVSGKIVVERHGVLGKTRLTYIKQ